MHIILGRKMTIGMFWLACSYLGIKKNPEKIERKLGFLMSDCNFKLENMRMKNIWKAQGVCSLSQAEKSNKQMHCLGRTPDCTFWTRIVASKMADRKSGER